MPGGGPPPRIAPYRPAAALRGSPATTTRAAASPLAALAGGRHARPRGFLASPSLVYSSIDGITLGWSCAASEVKGYSCYGGLESGRPPREEDNMEITP